MEAVKLVIALVPVSLLLCGSVALFRTTQSMWVSFQVLGSIFLAVVVAAHVCEALGTPPWMRWGSENSIGHYFDLASALIGLTLFPMGYLLYALSLRKTNSEPALGPERSHDPS